MNSKDIAICLEIFWVTDFALNIDIIKGRYHTVELQEKETSQQQPVFNMSKVQFYVYLTIVVTSLKQPLLCYGWLLIISSFVTYL